MKDNKIAIKINKPVHDVFAFTISPENTPLWISSLVKEETDEWPVKVGTIYKNQDKKGNWNEYTLTDFKENEFFEMAMKNGNYHVRYIFKPIDDNASELIYYEWIDEGELDEPFTLDILEKLKLILEDKNNKF